MDNTEKSSYLLYKLSLGYAITQCLYTVAKLNISDILLEKPLNIEDLSIKSGTEIVLIKNKKY